MSNLVDFAKKELELLRNKDDEPDEMQDAIEKCVIDIVEMFSKQGHTGSSASYVLSILKQVLAFEPVTPLTGEDDEWAVLDYGEDMFAQNKRCSHVFKRKDGTAYDTQAIIFRDKGGFHFTSIYGRRDITFPYRPCIEIVERSE